MMYRFYVLKVIFKQNKSKSSIGLASPTNRKSSMADALLFTKETLFHMAFQLACAWPTTTSTQSVFPSHSDLHS